LFGKPWERTATVVGVNRNGRRDRRRLADPIAAVMGKPRPEIAAWFDGVAAARMGGLRPADRHHPVERNPPPQILAIFGGR
jgi:hypothetical protein